MIRDLTIGQFFPGESAIHRLDPRTKLILTLVYIVVLFVADSPLSYIPVLAALVFTVIASGVGFRVLFKGLKPVIFIVLFTAALNIFYGSGNIIFQLGFVKITDGGLLNAFMMTMRIVLLLAGTSMLTYTTSPIMLTDGLERLLRPLKAIRLPVHELSMMMSIALRFIPTLVEETDKIMSAQKARGADFDSGNLVAKVKALIPVLVPLFVSAFRRSDELALAMECRCYHGGEGRTKLETTRFAAVDAAGFAAGAALIAAVVVANICFAGVI